jgi:3-oxoacyl-[acyl-carrier protein] reductase
MELGLEGKIAVITGGTRGIGFSIAEHLLDEGAHVAVCARSEEGIAETVARLSDRGEGRVIGRAVDVADAEGLSSWITDSVDILVPNVSAGGGPDKWQIVYEYDVMGTVRSVEAALPFLQASDAGAITIINTTAAVEAFRGPTAYAAFKAALLNYAKNLSRELAPSGSGSTAFSPALSTSMEARGRGSRPPSPSSSPPWWPISPWVEWRTLRMSLVPLPFSPARRASSSRAPRWSWTEDSCGASNTSASLSERPGHRAGCSDHPEAASTTRRRNRTFQAVGCPALPVLRTGRKAT